MAPEEVPVPRKPAPAGDASHGSRKGEPADESTERLLHELRVNQFELKVQNEELRRAQEDLSASRDRYLALFEFAPVGYFTLDRNGAILEANLTAARLLGVERSTLAGGRFSQFVSPADRNRFLLYYGQLGKPGGIPATEIRLSPADRSGFAARLEGAPVRHTAGFGDQCMLAVSDIGSSKRAEDLSQHTERPEPARASGIAHDLNNLMGSILAEIEMQLIEMQLADAPANSPLREGAEKIRAVAVRAAEMVRELMPNAGNGDPVLVPVEPERPVSLVALHATDTRAKGAAGNILLVEDEETLSLAISKMLRKRGFSVMQAGDGITAVDLFRANQPAIDVVVLDLTLPGMSGEQVFRELRLIQPDVRVILTTAYGREKALTALGGLQPWHFLRKPYAFGELMNLLES
jgi:PAS domain S-box-containing protein